jgi:hypothetical protein
MTMLYNYNIILYTSKSIDSVTFILPRLLLIIIHIHRSLINIMISYNYNIIAPDNDSYPSLTDQYNDII